MQVSGKLAEKGLHAFEKEPRTHADTEIMRLWIVVTDREKAHIYRKTATGIERIAGIKAGHAQSKRGDTGSSGDARREKRHHNDNAFIQKLTAWLDLASKENVFDQLILVASPHTLGELRASLSKRIRDRVTAEVDKDLVKLSEREIEYHLSKIVQL